MSPINFIPFDVFQIIIMSCAREKGESFALAASHVCRLRRHRVLDRPLLWNRLEFATNAPEWDKLEVKLERSGQTPLDIVIKEEVFLKSGTPHLRRIIRMVAPHVERWRSLRMVDVPHKMRRVLLDQLREQSTPLLHKIEVVQGKKYDRTWGRKIKSTSRHWDARKIFDGVPNLRHLEWTNPEAGYHLLPPFQNLLTLTIGPGTLDIQAEQLIQLVLRILPASPALQVLSLSHGLDAGYQDDVDVEHLLQPPATHSSLQLLHIAATRSRRGVILRSLILPKLRSLGDPIFDADIDIPSCTALAQSNSASNIRRVIITDSSGPGSDMSYFPTAIMNFQNLIAVVLSSVDFGGNNKWLPCLGDCYPHLNLLHFLGCHGYTVKAIQEIVELRINLEEVEALKELSLVARYPHEDGPSDEQIAWFSRVLEFNPIDTFQSIRRYVS